MITLVCMTCRQVYLPDRDLYTCPSCGPHWGTLEVSYPYEALARQLRRDSFKKRAGLFQFEALLPIGSHTPIDDWVGGTPLLVFEDFCLDSGEGTEAHQKSQKSEKHPMHLKRLLIKHDGVSLSGSLKDRASVVAMNLALAQGSDAIFCASTGNAASSLAILTAHSPLRTVIFVPQSIPKGKLAQLMAAGAEVFPVAGTYDEAFDVSMRIGLKRGWYCRNSAINPYLLEGKKTAAYEILVQNDYVVPDFCLVGVGDGTVVSGLVKGFWEFMQLGLVDRMPVVIGVQAEGAATLKHVFDGGAPFVPRREAANSLADSICVGDPRDVVKACTYLTRHGGQMVTVSDAQIASAMVTLTTATGVFAEPAAATTYAALQNLVADGCIGESATVALVVTGSGLKDPRPVEALPAPPIRTVAELEEMAALEAF